MTQGRFASGDRAVAASPSSPSVSPLRASIPSAAAIGVTGSQHGPTQPQKEMLCSVLIGFREGGAAWQHNGDCIGADAYAASVWRFLGGKIHLHPPTARAKRAFLKAHAESPPKPYLDRNADIAAECDVLVALPKEDIEQARGGTWATVRRARKLGKPILYVWPDGSFSIEHAQGDRSPQGQDRAAGLIEDESPVPATPGCAQTTDLGTTSE